MGTIAPYFCQDGASDFLRIDEKIDGEGVVAIFREVEGVAKIFIYAPFLSSGHAPACHAGEAGRRYDPIE